MPGGEYFKPGYPYEGLKPIREYGTEDDFFRREADDEIAHTRESYELRREEAIKKITEMINEAVEGMDDDDRTYVMGVVRQFVGSLMVHRIP